MITLNLINPEEKKVVTREQLIFTLRNTISLFLVVIIVIGVLFLICRIYLQNNYHNIVVQTALINTQNKWINKEIKVLNSELKNVNQIQKDFIKWSSVLSDFFELVPENNQLTSLSFDLEKNKVQLTGQSWRRADLLKYKDRLENSPLLKDVESPLSNLLYKEMINFSFNALFIPPPNPLLRKEGESYPPLRRGD